MDCYIDLKNGMPIATQMASVPATNNGSGLVRCTKAAHGLPDGAIVMVGGSFYVGAYIITKVNDDVFDLVDSVYDVNRTLTTVAHIGGSTWELAVNKIFIQNLNLSSADFSVKVAKTPTIDLGINASFTNLSTTVILDSALTKVVDDCVGNTWTAAANVTGGTSTVRHLGATSQQFTIAKIGTFNIPGKVGYKTFGSAQDFSSYSKLSFWFGTNSPYYGIQNGSCFKICLCSDAVGDVIVNEMPLFDVQGANNLCSMVLDYGGALGAGINSVALYATNECRSATGTIAVFLNNIVACNHLHHESIIGKNNGSNFWNSIKYIDGQVLAIMSSNASGPTAGLGFEHDTTENARVYAIEAYSAEKIASNGLVSDCRVSIAQFRPHVQLSFGWNKNLGIADGYTYIRAKSSYGYIGQTQNIDVSNLIVSNFQKLFTSAEIRMTNVIAFCMPQFLPDVVAFNTFSQNQYFINCLFYNSLVNDTYYVSMNLFGIRTAFENCYFGKIMGVAVWASTIEFKDTIFDYCTARSINILAGDAKLTRVTFNNAGSNAFPILNIKGGGFTMDDCTLQKTPLLSSYTDIINSSRKGLIHDLNGNTSENYVFSYPFIMHWQTSVKQTGLQGAWKIFSGAVTDITTDFKIAEIGVEQDVPITFRVWLKTDLLTESECSFVIKHDGTETMANIPSATASFVEYYIQIVPVSTQVVQMAIRLNNVWTNSGVYVGSISMST